MAHEIQWESIVNVYLNQLNNHATGDSNINPRVILGALMVKHMQNISDEETIQMIREILPVRGDTQAHGDGTAEPDQRCDLSGSDGESGCCGSASDADCGDENDEDLMSKREDELSNDPVDRNERSEEHPNHGRMLVDATACPQDIAYPTDLGLLNAGRMKCEEIIDRLYDPLLHGPVKPRTYREKARKAYLNTAKKKKKTHAELKVAIGKQLRYVNRNLKTIDRLLCAFSENTLKEKDRTYVKTIRKELVQQTYMRRNKTHSVVDRVVSIHQLQVRPIVRGKEKSKVEFGPKINVSFVDGYALLDHLSSDAYN